MLSRLVKSVKVRFGDRQRRAAREKAARAVIGQSKLFDAQWYGERYPDIVAAGRDPLDHFIRNGAAEGRNPSDRFDLRWYVSRNPDVAQSGINPLLHYLQYGRDEGRSIRAVGAKTRADEDFDLEEASLRKKGKAAKPEIAPYPSDFTSAWQARRIAWSALSPYLLPDGSHRKKAASDHRVAAVDWLSDFLNATYSESPEIARIRLFETMRRDASEPAANPRDPDLHVRENAHRLLTAYGLGVEAIADGWFSGDARLMLRVRASSAGGTKLCAFHYTAAGDLACCAEADIVDGDIQLINLALEHELCPVLLTWHAADGALTASALLPFPSLFRGGLHHAEIEANAVISGKRDTIGGHMASLALQAYCWANPDEGFAIKRIAVDLNGANGSETLFSAGTIAALATQFGMEMEARSSSGEEASHLLGQQLRTKFHGPRAKARAKAGRTLILPADGFPSLSCLAARHGGPQLGVSTFCVIDAGTRQPEALVCRPTTSAELAALHHLALPLPYPAVQEELSEQGTAGQHCGPPIMIRLRDTKAWKIDALMPLSPDTPPPALAVKRRAGDQRPRITVIIDLSAGSEQLALCLASLAHQTIADDLEILLVSDESAPGSATELFGDQRVALSPASGASPAERLNRAASSATSDYLLFLDAAVCLPDPRTLAFLLAMASQPQVASTSCALVREDDMDGSISVECAGYVEHWQADPTSPALLAPPADLARTFPASTYPVIANDMRLCMVPIGVWRDLGGLNARDFPDSGFDVDFGLRACAARLEQHCTTLTRAAVAQHVSSAQRADEITPLAIPQALHEQMSEQVSRLGKLGR